MKILALDSATEYCSAALWMDGTEDFRGAQSEQTHSQLLLHMTDELLRAHGVRVADLDGIAYGEGPGSFTGLRIACGIVQGLAFGAGLRVVGVGTLLAMAEGTQFDRVVCCLDARVQEIYHAAYRRVGAACVRGGASVGTGETQGFPRNSVPSVGSAGDPSSSIGCGWRVVHEPSVCAPNAAPPLPDGDWHACGSGFAAYRKELEARYAGKLSQIDARHHPHARDIARLAVARFEANESMSAEHAVPVYVRNKVALRSDERATR